MNTFFVTVPGILLDVVDEPWIVEHGRDIVILSIMALLALGAIIGVFVWIKKRKKAK